MVTNSILTQPMRDYLKTGESSYKTKLLGRMDKRIALGLADLSLAVEHIDRVRPNRVLMAYSPDRNSTEGGKSESQGWRQLDVQDTIIGALAFLMEIARAFDYGSNQWQRWVREAITRVTDVEHVQANIEAYSSDRLDLLESAELEDMAPHEAFALYETGRIEYQEVLEASYDYNESQFPGDPLSGRDPHHRLEKFR